MKPTLTQQQAVEILRERGVGSRVALLGLRGFYLLDKERTSDSGIYSDVIAVVTPSVFAIFNANTDPTPHRKAANVLNPGVWKYRLGMHGLNKPRHKQYMALVQADAVSITRNGSQEVGMFGISIQRGGYNTISATGCQAVFPDQWPAFIAIVEQEMKREGHTVVPYVLAKHQG